MSPHLIRYLVCLCEVTLHVCIALSDQPKPAISMLIPGFTWVGAHIEQTSGHLYRGMILNKEGFHSKNTVAR